MLAPPNPPSSRKIWLGRQPELRQLEDGLDEARAGSGGLFLITGEPGIGKTRLAEELGRRAAGLGFGVHWGRAWEAGGAPPYWIFAQLLRDVWRGLEGEALDRSIARHGPELSELVPELRQQVPGLALAPTHAVSERFQLFEAVAAALHRAAASRPRVLVLDDLHAADPSSLLLLQFVARDLRPHPLVVIGTYRDAETRLAAEIGRALASLAREACTLPLRRFDRSEVTAFLELATGTPPDEERVEAIHRQTEGNPLFLRELVQLRAGGNRRPEGIRELVRARLALMSADARLVLDAAAVVGREFGVEPLAALVGKPEPEVRAALEPAANAGLIEPVDQPPRWRFTHGLLREALYEDLSADRRVLLHRRAADELRARPDEAQLAELARHLLNAIPAVSVGEAAVAAHRAAERSALRLAFEDARSLYAQTCTLLDGVAGEERNAFEARLGLGLAQLRAGDVELGRATCRRAADLARSLGDSELLARAVLGYAYEFVPAVHDAWLIPSLDEVLARLPSEDHPLRARCMAQLAAERQPEPDTQPAIELARSAVAMARRTGDAETIRFTLTSAGMALLTFAAPEERMAVNRETLRLALAAGDKRVALRAHLFLSNDCTELGDAIGADAHVRAYEALSRELRHRQHWVVTALRAVAAMGEGRFDEAEAKLGESDRLIQSDEARGVQMAAAPVAFCCAAERYADLSRVVAQVRASFSSMGRDLSACLGEMLVARLYGRAGHRQGAAAQLTALRGHPIFDQLEEASWLALLAEPCHLIGDTSLAERLYPLLRPRAGRFFNLGPLGLCEAPYGRQLGLLAETLGRHDEAVAHLADAETRVLQSGWRGHLARVRYELAGALIARARPGDRARAATLLEQSRVLAAELGQAGLLPLVQARAVLAGALPEATAAVAGGTLPGLSLRREGESWAITWGADTLRLRDSRGLQVLERLFACPGQELHVLQLVSGAGENDELGDAGALLDAEAVQQYRGRLLDLREELEEADSFADAGRADRARREIELLTRELARAVGLGGRERRAGAAAERARTTVQKRLRAAIERIAEGLPDLGRHLDQSVRTGTFCGYLPDGRARRRRPS